IINVKDTGATDDGVDFLTINGRGSAGDPSTTLLADNFLLRKDFVARLNDPDSNGQFQHVERINYDKNINGRLVVNGFDGDDNFYVDDNSAITTVDGGAGKDYFQIGQVFGSLRTTAANVAPGDQFETTAVIIGVVQVSYTDATGLHASFNPSTQTLTQQA